MEREAVTLTRPGRRDKYEEAFPHPGGQQEEAALTIPQAREVAGKKFMWDGAAYLTRDDARQAMETYTKDGFEVHIFLEGDNYLVYTRRSVSPASTQ